MIFGNRDSFISAFSWLFLLAFSSGFTTNVFGQTTNLDSQTTNKQLDSYISPYLSQNDFSGTILIAEADRIVLQNAYGLANSAQKIRNDINTKFRVGSLSKTFTAASIVILANKGKLKLEDSLNKFFPMFPNGENITLEQLLLHRSGVGQLDDPKHYNKCYETENLVQEIGKQKPKLQPGTNGSYSNEGYNLLAAVIEKVSRLSYEGFLKKNIFEPLKMKNSGSFCKESDTKKLAKGYTAGAIAGTAEEIAFNESIQIGSGSVYSNARDLHKWLKAVDEKRLFDIEKLRYPYGWGKRNYSGKKLIEQSGLVAGFNAYVALYPNEKLYIVYLSNIQSGLFNRVPRDLNAVIFGGAFSKPLELSEIRFSNTRAKDYVGEFRSKEISIPLNVISKGESLYFKWGNYPFQRGITPISKDKFYHRAEYVNISFERNKSGEIVKMLWQFENGRPLIFNKMNKKNNLNIHNRI